MKATCITILFFSLAFAGLAQYKIEEFDINPGPGHSSPQHFTEFRDKLYFYAHNGIDTYTLYSYDSISGVLPVWQFSIKYYWYSTYGKLMATANGKLYFACSTPATGIELFSYDGIHPPTLVADINPGTAGSYPNDLTILGNNLYFTTNDSFGGALYGHLWAYNLTTHQVDSVSTPGIDIVVAWNSARLTAYKEKLFFAAISRTDNSGYEPFMYNPQTGKSQIVADIIPGSQSGFPYSFKVMENKLYFVASGINSGWQLYSYDGYILKQLTDSAHVARSPSSNSLQYCKGKIYFQAYNNNSLAWGLHAYDIKNEEINEVLHPAYGSFELSWDMAVYNQRLWFCASAPGWMDEGELWVYDGVHTPEVIDLPSRSQGSWPHYLTSFQNSLFFAALGNHGAELFKLTDSSKFPEGFHINLYPNPANNKAYLDISLDDTDVISIRVIDMVGREVSLQRGINYVGGIITIPLLLGNFSAGVYVCCILNSRGKVIYSGKLVKM